MALREPKDILHKGRRLDEILEAHARWLRNEGGARADLAGARLFSARLTGASLSYADLSRADLQRSDLRESDLIHAELTEADLREVSMPGSNLSFAVASQAQCHRADFSGCEMRETMLDQAHLIGSNLRRARLVEADLRGAKLFRADLRSADLTDANLEEAELVEALLCSGRLDRANLLRARLLGADLRGARLAQTILRQTKMDEALLGHTSIEECDLAVAFGLEAVKHFGPTRLDAVTLERAAKNLPPAFLYGAGVPASQAGGAAPLAEGPICFVSFAARDAAFAERLRLDLMANGVRCWFLPESLRWDDIELDGPAYDRLVAVCSRQSLENRAFLEEVTSALAREQSAAADVVVPVRLDDYLYDPWEHPAKPVLLRKTVGDFRSWKDQNLYRSALDWLLGVLRGAAAPA